MTETTNPVTPPPAAAQPAKTFWQKASRWGTIIAGVIVGLIGLLKIYNAFVPQMPGCAADETGTVLRDIFKKKDVELTALNDFRTVSDTSAQRDCQAHIETASETATIAYRISQEGKNFQVLITKVDATPR
jgi:hypothetical protein